MRNLKNNIEAAALRLLFGIFRMLPLDLASVAGGFMARCVGPLLAAHRVARGNLAIAFPGMKEREKRRLLMAMWDNLGRVAAELPHLPGDALLDRVSVSGVEHLPPPGKAALLFSGHIGNWELTYPAAHRAGAPMTVIYRRANNPAAEAIVGAIRATRCAGMIPKGARHSLKIIRAIKEGKPLAMLVDQKMNEGIPVPFFGRDAMTATAIAELALRYGLPLIPARVVRTKGCRFEATLYPPLAYEKTGDDAGDTHAIMTRINALLESWIREHPAQWFWVHKRWPGVAAQMIGDGK